MHSLPFLLNTNCLHLHISFLYLAIINSIDDEFMSDIALIFDDSLPCKGAVVKKVKQVIVSLHFQTASERIDYAPLYTTENFVTSHAYYSSVSIRLLASI